MQVFLTTTGTLSPVPINDLGKRPFDHPTTDYELTTEYSLEELRYSQDLQGAIDSGYITLEDENGTSITDAETQITFKTDHGSLIGLSDDDHTQYSRADGSRAFSDVVDGVYPTDDDNLATKEYVDVQVATATPLPSVLSDSEESQDSTSSDSYQQAWRYSPTLKESRYILQWYAEIGNSISWRGAELRIQINDSTTIAVLEKSYNSDSDGYTPAGGFYVYDAPSAGSINIDMDFRRIGGGTAYLRRKRIVLIEVAS